MSAWFLSSSIVRGGTELVCPHVCDIKLRLTPVLKATNRGRKAAAAYQGPKLFIEQVCIDIGPK